VLQEAVNPGLVGLPSEVRRVVAELGILNEVPEDIYAKAVHAAVQPEAQHPVQARRTSGLRQFRSG
jgi:hypothetical protein